MTIQHYPQSILLREQDRRFIKKSLKSFQQSGLVEFPHEKALQAKKIFQKINAQSSSNVFLFVCGGMGGSSCLFESFFKRKKNFYRISEINSQSIALLLKKKKSELNKSYFIFISKSGKTSEILFYKNILDSICSKKKLSLKNKVTILTQNLKSPLMDFAKRKQADIVLLEDNVPGRFSIFTLSGFLQFYFQGCDPLKFSFQASDLSNQSLNFLFSQKDKKEYWFCSSDIYMESFGNWLELVWSESLFKENKKRVSSPLLRHVNLYNLRHGHIEELIAKRRELCFLFFYFKKNKLKKDSGKSDFLFLNQEFSLLEQQEILTDFLSFQDQARDNIKKILKLKKIPFLFLELDFNELSFLELIFCFYQALFTLGDFFKVNIFENYHVDNLKHSQLT